MSKENKKVVHGTGCFARFTYGVGKTKTPTKVIGENPNSIDWCYPVESENTKVDTQDKQKEV